MNAASCVIKLKCRANFGVVFNCVSGSSINSRKILLVKILLLTTNNSLILNEQGQVVRFVLSMMTPVLNLMSKRYSMLTDECVCENHPSRLLYRG